MSLTEQCIRWEIHVLEDTVKQIKSLHNVYRKSVLCRLLLLDRLQNSQESKERVIKVAVAARKEAEAETERLAKALALNHRNGNRGCSRIR